jgi:type II secretory pathway component PulF
MGPESDILIDFKRLATGAVSFLVWMDVGLLLLPLVHYLLTLPMRRAERARLFLNLIESTIKQGRPIEETLISLAHSQDLSMGGRFHQLASRLEHGLPLNAALESTPRFLPPQITAMLKAGQQIGDLRKVLPACRQLLKDGISHTRGAMSYLFLLAFVITPSSAWILTYMSVATLPKLIDIGANAGGSIAGIQFVHNHAALLISAQFVLLLLLWHAAFLYIGGPRVLYWVSISDWLHFHLPWRRKRLQRDFSTLLAILLDSGVPEPEAVALAADSTANTIFRQRAGRVIEKLRQGVKLTQAVQSLDESGEFAWRLANAVHGHDGFLQALAGWHESLDAKAFQQEQAAAHGITSALVLWAGLIVGTVAISVFTFLVSITGSAVLW